ncbi:excinuclease UvrABC helicase subunit UvrB [Pedobacter cryoconitis]|nr:excinuclease UvrABC helicase subunit UvrB [Pedobacter cryoconitis]
MDKVNLITLFLNVEIKISNQLNITPIKVCIGVINLLLFHISIPTVSLVCIVKR